MTCREFIKECIVKRASILSILKCLNWRQNDQASMLSPSHEILSRGTVNTEKRFEDASDEHSADSEQSVTLPQNTVWEVGEIRPSARTPFLIMGLIKGPLFIELHVKHGSLNVYSKPGFVPEQRGRKWTSQ